MAARTHGARFLPRPRRSSALLGALTALALAAAPARAADPSPFALEGATLTVTTDRYVAVFRYGALVGLTNRLTGETYAAAPDDLPQRLDKLPHGLGTLAGLDAGGRDFVARRAHTWQGTRTRAEPVPSQHVPSGNSAVSVRDVEGGVEVTWSGLEAAASRQLEPEETFTLRLAVLPDSGDLEIRASARGRQKGVFSCGVLVAGLARDLTVIVPVFQGFAFRPADEKPFTLTSHWPTPWVASLVVAQGRGGSVGFWMADPKLQDRYLHLRNDAGGLDLVFEGVNAAPFDESLDASCRPIRLNVYRGNWTAPAEAFRAWWAHTFQVEPLDARRPRRIGQVQWLSAWGQLPPADIAAQGVHLCPQVWKVGPPKGDTGLLPFDMSKGPELDKLKDLLPRLRERDCPPYVYVNISHMSRAHPWAERFWKYRVVEAFDPDTLSEPPRFGAPESFEIHCGAGAWQEVLAGWTKQIHDRYGITGFYLDCAAGHANSAGGPIAGGNDAQGQVALMRRLRAAIPESFWGVEFVNEATAQAADIGGVGYDSWFDDGPDFPRGRAWREAHVHPIVGFLFNRYAHLMYFNDALPAFDEALGRLPLVGFEDLSQANLDYAGRWTFPQLWARLRCQAGLVATYPAQWEKGVRAYYADAAGQRYRIVAETPADARMIRTRPDGAEELVYWRLGGRSRARLDAGTGIDGWVAYDGDEAIGLNPQARYLYTAAARHDDWQVRALPAGAFVRSCRPYRNGLLVLELDTPDGKAAEGPVQVRTTHAVHTVITNAGAAAPERVGGEGPGGVFRVPARAPGVVAFVAGKFEPLAAADDGLVADLSALPLPHAAALGPNGLREPMLRAPHTDPGKKALAVMPNWTNAGAVEYLLELPPAAPGRKLLLTFRSQVAAYDSNRYTLTVCANGQSLLRAARKGNSPPQPHEVDLTAFAGGKVLLSLVISDAALFDWARLLEPRIVVR